MKKMFSMLVLALSLSLSVNAQHATPHVAPHVTVTPHVTSTPHVSAPVHISEPVHVSKSTSTVEAVTPSKTVVEPNEKVPAVMVAKPLTSSNTDTTLNKADTTKATSGAEIKQGTAPDTSTGKEDNSTSFWGTVGVFAVIVGIMLYVTFSDNGETNGNDTGEPDTVAPESKTSAETAAPKKSN